MSFPSVLAILIIFCPQLFDTFLFFVENMYNIHSRPSEGSEPVPLAILFPPRVDNVPAAVEDEIF